MKIILNERAGTTNFKDALGELAAGADTLSVAVSYLQVSGWELFHHQTKQLNQSKMRLVCTDQMGVTQPAAVKRAISSGVQMRNFSGNVIYHPKVYLAHDRSGKAKRCLIGSANLSSSAFTTSIEAGVLSEDSAALGTLTNWFDELFKKRSEAFTPESLLLMEARWRAAAAARARAYLRVRRELVVLPKAPAPPPIPEDLDALEDVFATLQPNIGLLCIDYAGNTVRNIGRVRELLRNWRRVSRETGETATKQRSEMKNLGFAEGAKLTRLGEAAAKATTDEEVARLWCSWLNNIADAELAQLRPELFIAKRVFAQFWKLQPDVIEYFLKHAEGSKKHSPERLVLNTIELLCNANAVVQDLSLDDFKTLAPLLAEAERIPITVRKNVVDYLNNKGTRTWEYPDRRIVLLAWKEVQA